MKKFIITVALLIAVALLMFFSFSIVSQQGTRTEMQQETSSLSQVVNDFKLLIEGDPELYMLFNEMFEQADHAAAKPGYSARAKKIKDYHQMLSFLNQALTKAPEFDMTGNAGAPINDALVGVMGTPAGAVAFLNPKVNQQLKKILNEWAVFLSSPDSRYVLSDDPETGWFGANALKVMSGFNEDFQCDPTAPYYGFTSWDNFFTRKLREGARPVAEPNNDAVIVSACESAPFNLATNVQLKDRFWIKKQPYSLTHMFDGDPYVEQFIGGTVYQAYLSAFSYHRWHAPFSGRIVKTKLIDGSYYAQVPSLGFDPVSPNGSQGYLTEVAARALILIEADNPDIGLVAILFVGMGDVSSNEITIYEGQHVAKGDQLGLFHFGGSTYCLIFRPGVKIEFDLLGQTPGLESTNIPVRSKLATVSKKQR
ncbi:MAG: phosphatidylserine decarboxylase family protein [Candidatus Saganbacteria bacterium]|nr:phosphatidylserine decarboxylase family protein [Candidatus Saganbacteria bacterium]